MHFRMDFQRKCKRKENTYTRILNLKLYGFSCWHNKRSSFFAFTPKIWPFYAEMGKSGQTTGFDGEWEKKRNCISPELLACGKKRRKACRCIWAIVCFSFLLRHSLAHTHSLPFLALNGACFVRNAFQLNKQSLECTHSSEWHCAGIRSSFTWHISDAGEWLWFNLIIDDDNFFIHSYNFLNSHFRSGFPFRVDLQQINYSVDFGKRIWTKQSICGRRS